ncbi:hypothetical protein Fmac_011242 [Flemingia macrophylla]|uniref:Uncharacterized protein n=1 Tax=Flemingia macrophylla TaxID=520843 RepID=A0ABD1MM68_9FABA
MSWDDHLTEESIFYTVPPTVMEAYRKSIESLFLQCEFGHREAAYDDDEGETSTYYLPGIYEGGRSSKSLQKKHKNRIKSCTHKASEMIEFTPDFFIDQFQHIQIMYLKLCIGLLHALWPNLDNVSLKLVPQNRDIVSSKPVPHNRGKESTPNTG